MENSKDRTGGMGDLSKKTRQGVDAKLADEEARMLAETSVDLESLRPQISDKESFDKLIGAVKISTEKNESIAELQQRITDLREKVIGVAKQVAALLK